MRISQAICDRCGKIAVQPSTEVEVTEILVTRDNTRHHRNPRDLCYDCFEGLNAAITAFLEPEDDS